jgi:hypothetical protein
MLDCADGEALEFRLGFRGGVVWQRGFRADAEC